jgi:hypothetical protein
VDKNGVRQTNPSKIMTQAGILDGIASGSGLVIAVGRDNGASLVEPIALISCN